MQAWLTWPASTDSIRLIYTTTSTQPYLFWYIQRANDLPRDILRRDKFGIGENGTEFQGRFHSELSINLVPFTIQDVRVSDSAVHYCALRTTVRKLKSNLIQKHRGIKMHVTVYFKIINHNHNHNQKVTVSHIIIIILIAWFNVIEWFQYNVVIVFSWFNAVCSRIVFQHEQMI